MPIIAIIGALAGAAVSVIGAINARGAEVIQAPAPQVPEEPKFFGFTQTQILIGGVLAFVGFLILRKKHDWFH